MELWAAVFYDTGAHYYRSLWLIVLRLKDRQAVNVINRRLLSAEVGNLGDVKAVGCGISVMCIFMGKGCRVYFSLRKEKLM